MPTLAQLLQAEGLDVSEELAAKLPTLAEASDEVRALADTKKDLLAWKDANKDKVSGFDDIQTKYEAELNEREKLAIANKDFEEQIKIRDERNERQQAMIDLRNTQALQATTDSALTEVASLFNSEYSGRLIASNLVKTSLADDGSITKKYQLGDAVFDSIDDLKAGMLKINDLASQMKGTDSGGAGGGGGQGGDGSTKPLTLTEKAKLANSDPNYVFK